MPQPAQTRLIPNLIYDVGMHSGEDTEYYLKKGFDVVAFEANPDLIAASKQAFADVIGEGRLRIVEGAIVPDLTAEFAVFYKYETRSKWGTIDSGLVQSSAKRADGAVEIKVPTVDFASVLRETGIPYYMKIDIEGADIHCLEALGAFETRPNYLSIEAIEQSIESQKRQIDLLESFGYTSFKAVPQARMHRRKLPSLSLEGQTVEHRFAKGSSGPFGADLGGEWRNRDQILSEYDAIFRLNRRFTGSHLWKMAWSRKLARKAIELFARRTIPGWYDTHARHGSNSNSER